MKTLFKILLLAILFASCDSYDTKYSCLKGTITVLNKQKFSCSRGGNWCFNMYLWKEENQIEDYINSLNKQD